MKVLEKFGLETQVAIVTGGGAGIGRGIAELFAGAGAAVVVSDLKKETAEAVAEEIRKAGGKAIALACDVTDEAAREALVKATVEAFGKLTILVNNAGGGGPKPFDMPMDDFVWAYQLNVFSLFRLSQLCGAAHGEGGRRRDPQHQLDGGREQERAHGLLRLVEGGGEPPHPQHRLRPRPEGHPRQRHRAGRDPHGRARLRPHAGDREGDAEAHAARPARRGRRTSPTRRSSSARRPRPGSAARC